MLPPQERCREVVQLRILPKAACFEEQCREVVQLGILPKAACLEGQCRESRGGICEQELGGWLILPAAANSPSPPFPSPLFPRG